MLAANGVPRLVVADREALVRDIVAHACNRLRMEVVGETADAGGLVNLCEQHRPDVVVSDVELEGGGLEERVDAILRTGTRLLVLSTDPSPARVTDLLSLGASGYLLHDSAPQDLAEAVQAVASGASALHPRAADVVLRQWRRMRSLPSAAEIRRTLTAREHEVLAALAEGLTAKAVARRLGVSVKTVENHKTRIFTKLGVQTRAHAVAMAIAHGIVPCPPGRSDGNGDDPPQPLGVTTPRKVSDAFVASHRKDR